MQVKLGETEVSGTYGPFEELPCVVGFFGRSGRLLTALGLQK
jgi:hypothetical protein